MRSLSPRHSQLAKSVQQDTEQQLPNDGTGSGLQDDSLAETPMGEGEGDDADNAEMARPEDSHSSPAADSEDAPQGDSSDSNFGVAEAEAACVSASDVGMGSNLTERHAAEQLLKDFSDDATTVNSALQQDELDSTAAGTASWSDQTKNADATGTNAAVTAPGSDQRDQIDQVDSMSTNDNATATALASGLVKVLTDCLANGYSVADKELRNTVLIVAQLLAQARQYRAALCDKGMLSQLLVMCTEPELGDCSSSHLKVKSQLALQ